jgi:hypothetical protein
MLRLTVLHARYTDTLSYYDDWLDAFCGFPRFESTAVDICRADAGSVERAVRNSDVVVLLHSTNADSLTDLNRIRSALDKRRGPMLVFCGNEVNLPGVRMSDRIDFLKQTGAEGIATQHLRETGEWLYAGCPGKVVSVPHALNPAAFKPGPGQGARKFDIVARSYAYPSYLGDDDRQRLFRVFRGLPLRVDIDGTTRFDRAGWAAFLGDGRGTVSTEAGSYYLERDDRTVLAIREHLLGSRKAIPLTVGMQKLLHALPEGLRKAILRNRSRIEGWFAKIGLRTETAVFQEAGFEEVFQRFFQDKPIAPVYGKCISSRHFDAGGTETCQILVEGRYNDILSPDTHYIPLRRNLSNLDEALRKFADRGLVNRMTRETGEFLRASHTYRQRMDAIEKALESFRTPGEAAC